MNEIELRNMMYTAQLPSAGPFSIRYPRGCGVTPNWRVPFEEIPIGKGRLISEGKDIAVLSIGHSGNFVAEAISKIKTEDKNISVQHYDMRFVKPIDEDILHKVGVNFKSVITVEDGTIVGGLGSAVSEFFATHGYKTHVERLGVPDKYIQQGSVQELYKECGFDSDSIFEAIINHTK